MNSPRIVSPSTDTATEEDMTFRRPFGVLLAEQRAREESVLREQREAEGRVVLEFVPMDEIRERLASATASALDIPSHCGELMEVCAGGVFECVVCDTRLTLAQIDEIAMSGPSMKNEDPIEYARDEMAVYGGES